MIFSHSENTYRGKVEAKKALKQPRIVLSDQLMTDRQEFKFHSVICSFPPNLCDASSQR